MPLRFRRSNDVIRWLGCDRPAGWCQVHHVKHWTKGGKTCVSNGVLLCVRHHHLVHEEKFSVEMRDRNPVFRRPDGSVIEENRAPP